MSDIKDLTKQFVDFRNERDWKQFHNPKDLALSLVLESSEVLEHFQWKNSDEIEKYIVEHRDDIGEELADVLFWVLLMSFDLNIDIVEAVKLKMEKNGLKYPISKAKGNHTKYSKLE
jgi:NTP pyrophosphatase (non-canonical NTP hydrolase)